ncbi:MAG: hypothetical protein PUP92_30965 [Rhizonema sp. PD38]|nr:hypothetical protein [Rhizonema sp. PD38]
MFNKMCILLLTTSILLGLGTARTLVAQQTLTESSNKSVEPTSDPGIDPAEVQRSDSPNPRPLDNSSTNVSSLLTKEDIMAKAGKLPANAIDGGAELTTMGEFHRHRHKILTHEQATLNRQVWVRKASFPKGLTTDYGTYNNATAYKTYDAQTGEYLGFDIDFHAGDFTPAAKRF